LCAETRAAANRGRIESIRAASRRFQAFCVPIGAWSGARCRDAANQRRCAAALLRAE